MFNELLLAKDRLHCGDNPEPKYIEIRSGGPVAPKALLDWFNNGGLGQTPAAAPGVVAAFYCSAGAKGCSLAVGGTPKVYIEGAQLGGR